MRWQRVARFAIALFVLGFAGFVFLAMRERTRPPGHVEPVTQARPGTRVEGGNGTIENVKNNKRDFTLSFSKQYLFPDGRYQLEGVKMVLPDRDGKDFTVESELADVVAPPDKPSELTTAKLTRKVRLTTNGGVVVTAEEANYDGKEGILTVPGPVQFSRGRMKGSGVGATYDKNKDVLWIQQRAEVTVVPDAAGAGALQAWATRAGLARADNYMKLEENARIVSDGRTAEASDITILLDESGQKIQQLQLRNKSHITGNGTGAQSMSAKDIDMMYAADGRTLQSSRLMENGVVELPGSDGGAARRVAGSTIDIGMAPDGSTVTSLNAQDKVQVDLPGEGDAPAKEIRSATLRSTGAPGQGLQNAVFEGGVDYRETRPATAKAAAVQRTARSQRLVVDTKPGFGAVQRADFHGNVHFADDQISADAPRAVYNIDKDSLELTPSAGDTGIGPVLTNSQFRVEARNIQVSPTTQKLHADTDVRSTIKPQAKKGDANAGSGRGGADETRMPAMLNQDKPVNVTSNRLDYDGVAEATYSGNALLFQDQSRIAADTIVSNEKTGNLTARVRVQTTMILQDEDPKTKVKKPAETKAWADNMVYDDAKRLAVYTATGETPAKLTSTQGTINGTRIDLYLKESGNELDRAEADGKVSVSLEKLFATGQHLVYTAATDTHVLTGQPVVAIQKDDQGSCKRSEGVVLTYQRSVDRVLIEAMPGLARVVSKPLPACPAELRH